MLYPLFDYLDRVLDIPGTGVFRYISFRAGMASLVSLIITITFGHHIINWIRNRQIGETVRDLGLEGQNQKKGTPTMGGLITSRYSARTRMASKVALKSSVKLESALL